jgi:nitrogenase molybdenum-iron protein alpha/beta subunit
MTKTYLRNITADYITGAVSACEGIKDSLVLINGPLGCKFYHGYAAGQSMVRPQELWRLKGDLKIQGAMSDKLMRSQYFAGSPEIPGSNLRYEDFIFGTAEQLARALNDIFAEHRYSFFSVIQAPGTSLLGESLEGLLDDITAEFGIPHLFIEAPKLSEDIFLGYDETIVRILKLLELNKKTYVKSPAGKKGRPKVNLFGFYTYEKFLEGDLAEITKLLSLCGADVACAAGADSSLESLRAIPDADANIFLSAERCARTAEYLSDLGMPSLDFGCLPVGPDLTESFVREVSELLKTDCAPALEEIEKTRARIFYHMAKHFGAEGFPRDLSYALEAECSMIYSYADFLTGYLGIMPQALHDLYRERKSRFSEKLAAVCGAQLSEKALRTDLSKVKDAILLGNANSIAHILTYSGNIFGIEISLPSSGYVNVLSRTYTGCSGALQLLEQLINGARLLKAWE